MKKIYKLSWLFAVSTLASPALFATTDEEEAMRADCQTEGEGGGLSGPDLEEYIQGCLSELKSLDLVNTR